MQRPITPPLPPPPAVPRPTYTLKEVAQAFVRSEYGVLITNSIGPFAPARQLLRDANEMASKAAMAGHIPAAHDSIERDRKMRFSGSATHHEVYDLVVKGGNVTKAMICVRESEGSRYGVRTVSKSYYLLSKCGRGVRVAEIDKYIAAKTAKAAGNAIGIAIKAIEAKIAAKAHV